jgi:hypothetical protein
MSRETYTSITGNPRQFYKATGFGLTLAFRRRHSPMNRLSCVNQHANIRLINRREQSFPSHSAISQFYFQFFVRKRPVFTLRGLDKKHNISEFR